MRAGSSAADNKNGLRQADYLAIGISSALLGMLYVAGLIGFVCYRRRRRQLENVHVKLAAGPVEELGGVIRLNPLLQADARLGQLSRSSPENDATRPSTRSSNRSSSQVRPTVCVRCSLHRAIKAQPERNDLDENRKILKRLALELSVVSFCFIFLRTAGVGATARPVAMRIRP